MDLCVGQKFGEYEVSGVLDTRMGPTYKVEHCLTRRTEVMKVLSAELASETEIKRFEREIRVLARLSHPNIAVLHNTVQSERQLLLFMEFVEGQTLESLLGAQAMPLERGINYINQILLALRYAHQQGIVHRDITPANVMITPAGEVKLSDFGLSKAFGDSLLTNCGEILGSLPYLAPEQIKGTTQPDPRSDLYSVGAILYELLTGQRPFGENRRLAAVLTDSEGSPRPPSQLQAGLSPQWDAIISRALARDPMHRYQSADEFLHGLADVNDKPQQYVLPQVDLLYFGLAIFAGVLLAGIASPAINPFRSAPPAMMPMQHFHISPPAFAPTTAVVSNNTVPEPKQPSAKPTNRRRSTRAVTAKSSVIGPRALPLSNPEGIALTPSSEPTVPASAEQDLNEALSSERPNAAEAPQTSTQKKRKFWSKLNLFRKKSPDLQGKP